MKQHTFSTRKDLFPPHYYKSGSTNDEALKTHFLRSPHMGGGLADH